MVARYDKEGQIVAVGKNCAELSRMLGISLSVVARGVKRGSKLYAVIPDDEEDEDEQSNS